MSPHLLRASSTMKIHCSSQRFFSSLSPLVSVQLPSPRETHVWYILPDEVKNASLLDEYLELLSPCEKENVFCMRGDELKKRALLARALVRTTIARYQINSQVSPRSLKFTKNIHGKPEVEWQRSDDSHPPPLHFNLSHTSSLIACGVTIDSPIGIDVEEKQRTIKNDVLSFARRYFSHEEVDFLAAITDAEVQRQEFLKLWTLKEAYVKALGRGFSGAPFRTFTIRYQHATGGSCHSGNLNCAVCHKLRCDLVTIGHRAHVWKVQLPNTILLGGIMALSSRDLLKWCRSHFRASLVHYLKEHLKVPYLAN